MAPLPTPAAIEMSGWVVFLLGEGIALVAIPFVLLSRRTAQAKTAWILVLVGWPFVGLFLYLLFGRNRLKRRVLALRSTSGRQLGDLDRRVRSRFGASASGLRFVQDLSREALAMGATEACPGNAFHLLTEGPDAFRAALEAIEAASHHVHLMSYIFRADRTGQGVVEALARAAARGVAVRVLFDGLGTLGTRRRFFRPIEDAGGEVAAFLPLRTNLFRINLRNHRKILVVDGGTGFVGGMNIGDEYAADREWRDIHCRIRGPAAAGLQRIFVEDWCFATEQVLDDDAYFPRVEDAGEVPVQVVPSGPDDEDAPVENLFFSAIAGARRRVDLVTPYFVPTEPLLAAIRSALRRGRRVRALLGEKTDSRMVRWASESILPPLLEAGLELWRYPGMVHGKVLVVDDAWATLGSTNFDARSFRLNFEVNVAFPHAPTAVEIRRHVDHEIERSRRVHPADLRYRLPGRVLRNLAGVFAPVL
ncbi:MAG: cardiolipin synthase [Planctomycetota bacterium]|jgi:cardiolipin synthase